MDQEDWTVVDLLECLNGLRNGFDLRNVVRQRVAWADSALVHHAKHVPNSPEAKELENRVVEIEEHGCSDCQADVLEPVCIVVSVDSLEKLVDDGDVNFTAVPWSQYVEQTRV